MEMTFHGDRRLRDNRRALTALTEQPVSQDAGLLLPAGRNLKRTGLRRFRRTARSGTGRLAAGMLACLLAMSPCMTAYASESGVSAGGPYGAGTDAGGTADADAETAEQSMEDTGQGILEACSAEEAENAAENASSSIWGDAFDDSWFDGYTGYDLMDSIKSSVLSDGAFSTSEYLAASGLGDFSFSDLYGITAMGITGVDMGYLNESYGELAGIMSDTYDAVDLSGSSAGCMELFESTYGDVLDSVSISYADIPSGFDVNSMLSSASSQISSAYSSATGSGSFASCKDSISIGKVFSEVDNFSNPYTLAFTEDTLSAFSGIASSAEKSAFTDYAGYSMVTDSEGNKQSLKSYYQTMDYASAAMGERNSAINSSSLGLIQASAGGTVSVNYEALSDQAKKQKRSIGISGGTKGRGEELSEAVQDFDSADDAIAAIKDSGIEVDNSLSKAVRKAYDGKYLGAGVNIKSDTLETVLDALDAAQ